MPTVTELDPAIKRLKLFFDREDFASVTSGANSKKLTAIYVALDEDRATTSDQMDVYYEHSDLIRDAIEAGRCDMLSAATDTEAKRIGAKLCKQIDKMIANYKKREPAAIAKMVEERELAEAARQLDLEEQRQAAIEQYPELAGRDDFVVMGGWLFTGQTEDEMSPGDKAESDAYWRQYAEKNWRKAKAVAEVDAEVDAEFKAKMALMNEDGTMRPAPQLHVRDDVDPPKPEDRIDDWRDPVDLWANFDPPELPPCLLPKVIEDYARITAETMGCDPGGIAMAALAVCAGVTTDDIQLKIKKHSDDWTESARLWVALVGDPSSKKSPIRSVTNKPINKLEAELLRIYAKELAEWNALTPEEKANGDNPKPTRMRYVMDDYTLESMQDILHVNPQGVLLSVDEGSGWIGGLDKYSNGKGGASKDRGAALSGFNGAQYPVDRVQRGSFLIPNWGYSLMCGIQPSVMRRLAADSYDDGFLQRMLIIVLREATLGKDVPTPPIAATYDKLVRRLSELAPPPPDKWNLTDKHGTLRFDSEAQELRNEMEKRHLDLTRLQSINKKLSGHIGKYDGYFGRLCVLFHCIENAHANVLPTVVTLDTAQRVADFMQRFLLPHALAFFAGTLGLSDQHDELTDIAGFVLAHRKSVMTFRDAQRGSRAMRKLKQRDTIELYEQMEALGWFKRQTDGKGRQLNHWLVNPKLHVLFADRAKRERETRKATQELILQSISTKRGGQT